MKSKLQNYIKAAFPCVAILTTEEGRAVADVIDAAKSEGRSIVSWSATEGMLSINGEVKAIDDTEDLLAACRKRFNDTVIVLRDPHNWPFDRDPVLLRGLRDFIQEAPDAGCTVVVIAPKFTPDPTIEKMVTILEYELPHEKALGEIAASIAEDAGLADYQEDAKVIRALGGLTKAEAENALALSYIETKGFDPEVIYREKCMAVKRSGLLEIHDPDPRGLDAIGGMEVMKAWIQKRTKVWTPAAIAAGLPPPKGMCVVGVPGSGKSLTAKAVGTAFAVPTLCMDVGSLFNSLIGESERRTNEALALAEAMAPCILWLDEIDKAFAGMSGSGQGDSGVGKRVFGAVIKWLQERRRPVFLVATANDVTALPPELLRKGRFDELWAVDLPTAKERAAIFNIHLRKHNRTANVEADSQLVENTESYTGAEIEAVIHDAMFTAFDDGEREVNHEDLMDAAADLVPLATTAKEKIEAVRKWASTRARFASEKDTKSMTGGRRRLTK